MLDLDIMPNRLEIVQLANGKDAKMFGGTVMVSMEGVENIVSTLIGEGMPTVGVGLLKRFGYNLNIDFKKDILLLQK